MSLELCKFRVHLAHPLQVGVVRHLFSGVMQSQVYVAFRNTSHEKDVVILERTSIIHVVTSRGKQTFVHECFKHVSNHSAGNVLPRQLSIVDDSANLLLEFSCNPYDAL